MPSVAFLICVALAKKICGGRAYYCYMYYVYIVKMSNGNFYTGFSNNLKLRIKEHNEGKCSTTSKYRPVALSWYCSFTDKYKALEFEQYLKRSSGIAFRNKHLV